MKIELFAPVKNIVFDLGGVLYDVDYSIVEREFAALQRTESSLKHHNAPAGTIAYTRETQPQIFTDYEIGAITTAEFCEGLRKSLGLEGTDADIASAWNAMLLGVYPGRNALTWRLKQRYHLALLSNTNALHIEHVRPECHELFSLFDKLFFSYEQGLRKPQAEIFRLVLEEMHYEAHETLFVDDSPQHIEAARALGIQTLWLQHPQSLELVVDMLTAESAK
jgi:glucose-1-phosphatase